MATLSSSNQASEDAGSNLPPIPLYDRFVLWMFLIGFVLFGMILLGDLFSGLLR